MVTPGKHRLRFGPGTERGLDGGNHSRAFQKGLHPRWFVGIGRGLFMTEGGNSGNQQPGDGRHRTDGFSLSGERANLARHRLPFLHQFRAVEFAFGDQQLLP